MMKEKIKEFTEKHPELKSEVSQLLWYTAGCGIGYIVGCKITEYRFTVALERIDKVEPEFMPLINRALTTLKNK